MLHTQREGSSVLHYGHAPLWCWPNCRGYDCWLNCNWGNWCWRWCWKWGWKPGRHWSWQPGWNWHWGCMNWNWGWNAWNWTCGWRYICMCWEGLPSDWTGPLFSLVGCKSFSLSSPSSSSESLILLFPVVLSTFFTGGISLLDSASIMWCWVCCMLVIAFDCIISNPNICWFASPIFLPWTEPTVAPSIITTALAGAEKINNEKWCIWGWINTYFALRLVVVPLLGIWSQ